MSQMSKMFSEIRQDISITQRSKSYRVSLAAKRLNAQLLKGEVGEKKDFISWFLGKILKREYHTKLLYEFDYLENVKKKIDILEGGLTDSSMSVIMKDTCQIWIFDELSYSGNYGNNTLSEMAKTFNEMGQDVYYAYFQDANCGIREPVSRKINLKEIKLREFAAMVKKNAIFLFCNCDSKFQKYLQFAKNNNLKTIILDEIVNRNDYWIDNALFEPNLKYSIPDDMKKKMVSGKSFLVERIESREEFELLNKISKEKGQHNFYVLQNDTFNELHNPNIYFIGLKQKYELPMYYAYADAVLMISSKNISNYYISRCIAMYKKVVLFTNEKVELPNVVCCDTIDAVCDELELERINIAEAERFSMNHSYYKLCNNILNLKSREINISIIVLNRNNKNVIFRCVDTLLKFNSYSYEVIVVDNDSTDGSYEMLLEKYTSYPNVKIIKNDKNGCSSGRNLGVLNSVGEYVFFLDSDQWIIGDHWMDIAIDIMDKCVGIGAVAWNAAWFYPGKLSGLIVDYLPNRGMEPNMLYRTDIGLLATSGFLMKRRLFDAVDGFDEFYDPTCFEDTDLSLKVRNYGYEIAYTPYMLIKHLPHQTTKSGSDWHKQLMERNELYCKNKWEKIDPSLFEYYY